MDKRQQIQMAALKLISINGVHATPMSAIAKEAKTGMGTIYNYYPNKEDLINSIYVFVKEQERSLFQGEGTGSSLAAHFETYYKASVQFFLQHPLFFSFMEQLQASPIITAESREAGRAAISSVVALLEKGKAEGVVKDIPTAELLQFIGGSILSYLRWQRENEQTNEQLSLANQLQMVWDAIKR